MILAALHRWFNQAPAGFRPGHTLACALDDLRSGFRFLEVNGGEAVLQAGEGGAVIRVVERLERHFQMHLVSLDMTLAVAARFEAGIRIAIRNTGLLRRTGITCAVSTKDRGKVALLVRQLTADPALKKALMELDFRRCILESTEQGWLVTIEPYGASEVVNRMPSFRRYIRLDTGQVQALQGAFTALQRALTVPGQSETN